MLDGFSKKYNINKLVYYEEFHDINEAIAREKQLKGWKRFKKNVLVETDNPSWAELSFQYILRLRGSRRFAQDDGLTLRFLNTQFQKSP